MTFAVDWALKTNYLSIIILPSPVAYSVFSFSAFGPVSCLLSINIFKLGFFSSSDRLFCIALVFGFFLAAVGRHGTGVSNVSFNFRI